MKKNLFPLLLLLSICSGSAFAEFRDVDTNDCPISRGALKNVLESAKQKDPNTLTSLSNCLKNNNKLVFQVCLIDPAQMQYAPEFLRKDENFVYRLIKINPQIIKYISDDLKSDQAFLEKATFINRDALKYAAPALLDNKRFMLRMIKDDSQNYVFASARLKADYDCASLAFADNGLLFIYAPTEIKSNKKLATIALKSNITVFDFLANDLKQDKNLRKLASHREKIAPKTNLETFLQKTYLHDIQKRNLGLAIDENASLFAKKHRLINRNYITKWERSFEFKDNHLNENIRLITAESLNYPNSWQDDLKKYPGLVKKISNFFSKRHIDRDTVDNLYLTYLWKIKSKPLTLAFNLFLLRPTNDEELGDDYRDITSLTAIVEQNGKDEWRLTVVETILDSEIEVDSAYKDGLKRYVLQDLYLSSTVDNNPKLIFRVDDRFDQYFDIYGKQQGGKYQLLYRINPLEIKSPEEENSDDQKN